MGNNLNIVTSNEHNNLSRLERRLDVSAIYAQFSATEPIVLWQEIKHSDHHADLDAAVPAGTQHLFPTLPIPITVPKWYSVMKQFSVRTKENTAAQFETGKVERYYAAALLRDTTRPNLPAFWVINTHFTNGCDWENKDATDNDVNSFLRPYWLDHWDLLQAEILKIRAAGQTSFYGGDFNRQVSPPFHSTEKLAVGNGRIDKLAVIDRSVATALKATGMIETYSDHQAQWARWELTVQT